MVRSAARRVSNHEGTQVDPGPPILRDGVPQRSLVRSQAYVSPFPRRVCASGFVSFLRIHPRTRGWRSADRRTLLLCRACEARRPRERNAGRPVATGTPSRRSVVAIFGRGPVLPPPAVAPEPMSDLPASGYMPGGRGPGPPALRFAPQSRDATPRSIVRIVSGDAPSERGCEMCSINSFRSQEISAYRS